LVNVLTNGVKSPVQKIIAAAKKIGYMKKREARQMLWFICTVLLQCRSKEDNEKKRNESYSKLGCEPRGEKGSSCRLQAYTVWHDGGKRDYLRLRGSLDMTLKYEESAAMTTDRKASIYTVG
jgi:hypothetical protein